MSEPANPLTGTGTESPSPGTNPPTDNFAVVMDDRPVLACLAHPQGGETVSTRAIDGRPPPWA